MKPLSPVEIIANTYEGLAPVPMDLARRVRVEQLRRRREAGRESEYRYHRVHRTLDDLAQKAAEIGAAAGEIADRAAVQVPSDRGCR